MAHTLDQKSGTLLEIVRAPDMMGGLSFGEGLTLVSRNQALHEHESFGLQLCH